MMTFLLVVQALIAAAMVGVILMQRSEGGGLGMGGSPSGLMSARGAADFLTRATTILATIFVVLCIVLAVIAAQRAAPGTIDTSLRQAPIPTAPAQPSVPLGGDPLAAAANGAAPVAAAVPDQNPPAATSATTTARKPGASRTQPEVTVEKPTIAATPPPRPAPFSLAPNAAQPPATSGPPAGNTN